MAALWVATLAVTTPVIAAGTSPTAHVHAKGVRRTSIRQSLVGRTAMADSTRLVNLASVAARHLRAHLRETTALGILKTASGIVGLIMKKIVKLIIGIGILPPKTVMRSVNFVRMNVTLILDILLCSNKAQLLGRKTIVIGNTVAD